MQSVFYLHTTLKLTNMVLVREVPVHIILLSTSDTYMSPVVIQAYHILCIPHETPIIQDRSRQCPSSIMWYPYGTKCLQCVNSRNVCSPEH